jgi:predicted transcriptional regulator
MVFPVRLEPELRAALETRAETDHTTASDIVRNALRAYLNVA